MKKEITNSEVIGIGFVASLLPNLILTLFLAVPYMLMFFILFCVLGYTPILIGSVCGAFLGKHITKARIGVWGGAIAGTLLVSFVILWLLKDAQFD